MNGLVLSFGVWQDEASAEVSQKNMLTQDLQTRNLVSDIGNPHTLTCRLRFLVKLQQKQLSYCE